jgi:hypothetical protein
VNPADSITFAGTEMVAAVIDPRTVAERLGHADPSITLRLYARSRQASDDAAEALERAPQSPGQRFDLRPGNDRPGTYVREFVPDRRG